MFPDEFYPGLANMAGMTGGFLALSLFRGDDDFNNLPEEVREAIDRHRDEFANEEEMRAFAQRMMKKK